MTAACVDPLPLYRPRDPQASDLWRLLDQHFETFQQVYDERFTSWYQQGADVQRLLHQLSVYLGHVNLRGTQVYLSMTDTRASS